MLYALDSKRRKHTEEATAPPKAKEEPAPEPAKPKFT